MPPPTLCIHERLDRHRLLPSSKCCGFASFVFGGEGSYWQIRMFLLIIILINRIFISSFNQFNLTLIINYLIQLVAKLQIHAFLDQIMKCAHRLESGPFPLGGWGVSDSTFLFSGDFRDSAAPALRLWPNSGSAREFKFVLEDVG